MMIGMPTRILDKHVGGNTTYARALEREYADRGIEVGRFGVMDNPYANIVSETLAGLRKSAGYSLVHYVADTGPIVRTRVPSVVTVHGVASNSVPSIRKPVAERVWRSRVGRALSTCDRAITVSESSADDIADVFSYPREQIRVIPHGLSSATARRGTTSSEVKRVEAEFPEYLLYVGNLEPRKNLVNLINAMADPRLAGTKLVIAGRLAWDYEPILRAIEASDSVEYLGFVSETDRQSLMERAHLFVFPSLYEGFGFPVLEALAAGTPVICSDRGSLAEVAGPAMRFDELNCDAIAEGLCAALENTSKMSSLRIDGPLWAQKFTWSASAEAHLEVYGEIA